MPRKTTLESIEKLKMRPAQRKFEPLAKKVLIALMEGKLSLEEQPIEDDGIHEIHEYYGELGDLEVSVQRLKKHNGINPRFNLRLIGDTTSVDIAGRFARKAYSMAALEARKEEEAISDADVEKLLNAID
jgi:hypothetical protein